MIFFIFLFLKSFISEGSNLYIGLARIVVLTGGKKLNAKAKGVAMFGFAIGLIVLFVGVALMYMLPEYIISALNATSTFSATTVSTATTQAGQIRSLGFVVIVISVVWLLISVISKEG